MTTSQYPRVIFPDAVNVLVTWLETDLAARSITTQVYDAPPASRPARFVTVRRTGGVRLGPVIDKAQITVESWAESLEDATDLAANVRAAMHHATGQTAASVPIGRVEEASGPADLPDPLSDQSRVSQTFIVALRGAPPS